MTARLIQAEKFYQKLQKKFSRRINLDRSRIFSALKKFNVSPDKDISADIINVVGSDGKNCVCKLLSSILIQNKKNVTTFTSPSIVSPLDRIFIKNKFITLKKFKNIANRIITSNCKLTLFEVITLIYVLAINKLRGIDYHIVEAGAGFDKDSTNLWNFPKIQAVTNINLQHLGLFGVKTIKEICKIKCGALSHNTNIYIGKQNPKTLKIIKKILKKNPSQKYFYGKDFKIKKKNNFYFYSDKKGILRFKANHIHSDGLWESISLGIKIARDLKISNKIILRGLLKVKFIGRFQFIKKGGGKLRKLLNQNEEFLIDGCHSEEAVKNHIKFLKGINKSKYAIWSLMKNRNPEKYVKHLECFKKIITIKIPNETNSCSAQKLARIGNKNGIKSIAAPDIKTAIRKISDKEKKIISVIGSLYTAGEVLKLN